MARFAMNAAGKGAGSFARWGVLLLLFGLTCLPVLAEEKTTFAFTPPDGLNYTETSRTKMTTSIKDGAMSTTDVREEVLKTKTEIHQTKDGYSVVETVLSVEETQKGQAVDADNFLLASVGVPVTYHIGKDGKLLSIDGIDKIVRNCKKTMSVEEVRTSGYLVTEKGITEANKASWYEGTQSLIGRTVKVGDSWNISVAYPTPGGKKDTVEASFNMVAREQNNGKDGIHLRYVKRHDMKALADARAYYFQNLIVGTEKSGAQIVTIKQATEEGDVVLDPITLQPLSSSSSSVVISKITKPDEGSVEITEQTDEETSVDLNPGAFTGLPVDSAPRS